MTYENTFKHSQEKGKSSSINFYSFPSEKEDIVFFDKDQLKSIQFKGEDTQLGNSKLIE